MGIREEITEAINEAFDTSLSDAINSFTVDHISRNESDFDSATGLNVPIIKSGRIRGILLETSKRDVDFLGAEPNTSKLLVLASEITSLGFSFGIGDTITDGSLIYTVYNRKNDPANVTYVFFIKASNL